MWPASSRIRANAAAMSASMPWSQRIARPMPPASVDEARGGVDGALTRAGGAAGDVHGAAFGAESEGDALADASARARHHGDLSGQLAHPSILVRSRNALPAPEYNEFNCIEHVQTLIASGHGHAYKATPRATRRNSRHRARNDRRGRLRSGQGARAGRAVSRQRADALQPVRRQGRLARRRDRRSFRRGHERWRAFARRFRLQALCW